MKTLTKALGIAGITLASFLPLNGKGQDTEENKQLYEDFVEFVKKGKNKKLIKQCRLMFGKSIDYEYSKKIGERKIHVSYMELKSYLDKEYDKENRPKYLLVINTNEKTKHQESFFDENVNGLNIKEALDYYSTSQNDYSYKNQYFKNMSSKEQLDMKEKYESILKEILHQEKDEGY